MNENVSESAAVMENKHACEATVTLAIANAGHTHK